MRKGLLLTASLACLLLGTPKAFASGLGVAVRAAEHESYDRIVFDWPQSVKYHFSREGKEALIVFEAEGEVRFPADFQSSVKRAQGFTSRVDQGRLTISFTVSPEAKISAFSNGSSIVVDVRGDAAPPERNRKLKAEIEKPEPPKVAEKKPEPVASEAPETLVPEAAPLEPVFADEPKPVGVQNAKAQTSTPAASAPRPEQQDFGFSLADDPTLIATLDPHIKTRAAIFLRANVGYVVFDKKMTLSPSALQNGVPSLVSIQTFDLPKNSGYRFAVPPNAAMQATLDGTAWKIYLTKKKRLLPVTTSLVAQPDFALGARFLLPLPDVPEPIRFTDPIVGDDLILIPLAQSEAFTVEQRMPDFAVLPAAQGLVLKPTTDKFIVRSVSDGIEITAEGGLLLSRAADTGGGAAETPSKKKAVLAGKSIFDFASWKGKTGETFTQTRQRLQQTIVDVPEAERNRARMELARFYFANGYGEEAASLLLYLAKQVPDLRAHADFMALLGAAEVLAYRSEEGLSDLTIPALADQPEVVLWQAIALAQMRNWQHAEEKFSTKEIILTAYPEPFFSRYFVLAIESALAMNQDHEAADWLQYIMASPHSESIDPALAFLRGAIDAKAGRASSAEAAWKEAQRSNDRLYKVRAELALIDFQVANRSLTPAQAADRLEALRFAWRGDDLEIDILRRLGQFYIQSKNLKIGINALSQAAMLYPSSPLIPEIRAEMAANLREAFLGNSGKKLSPLDALTLYRQYRDLLPAGPDGDLLMTSLSERLVAVDLLDQAAILLEDLAKNRLQGIDKDRAILRLAAIRLLDHRPAPALVALDMLQNSQLSAEMKNENVLLRARALSELKKNDDAIALLKDNATTEAKLLRADIAMRSQEWMDAAGILMDLIGPPPASGFALSKDQATWLLSAAIAYALADDRVGLDKLAIDYGEGISTMPQNSTFLMLTRPEKGGQMRDLAAAQAQLSQVDMFQGFLNNYRTSASAQTQAAKKP